MKQKNGVYIERFEDLNMFLRTIDSRPLNKVFKNYDTRYGSCSSDVSFTKTKTYEESEVIMKTGYKDGLKDLQKGKQSVHLTAKSVKTVPTASVIGYAPHVPNAIVGIPCSMISHNTVSMKSKMMTIVYDVTASCNEKADDFVKAGRVLLSFIELLELKGYRIKLYMMLSACKGSEKSVALIKVKDFRQPVNPLKLSYMMIHPSFLRRQGLKWVETNPKLTERGFRAGHGSALYHILDNSSSERKWLKDNAVIGQNDVFVSYYDLKNTDHLALVKKLGIKQ